MNPAHADALQLSTHMPFVQRLARGLLGGDGEDVAQEAMVRAWMAPAPPRGSVRAWLGAIVGNLAHNQRRSARRRVAHEARAAAAPSVPAVDEIVAREEVRARVVAAVFELPPALRDVVLLRFYEGMDSAAIGAAVGAPASTVRSRLQQGLDHLRARLDEQHGRRAAWATPLATWQVRAAAAPVGLASVVLRVAIGWRVFAVAVVALVLLWRLLPLGPGPVVPGPVPVPGPGPVAQSDAGPRRLADPEPVRSSVGVAAAESAVPPGPTTLWGRVVVAATNAPLPGAAVALDYRLADEFSVLDVTQAACIDHLGDAVTDAEGRFRFAVARATQYRLRVVAPGFPEHVQPLVTGGSEVLVRMEAGAGLRGRVSAAADRAPVAGAEVVVQLQGLPGGVHTTTAADGSFFFADLPCGPSLAAASAPGCAISHQEVELRAGQIAELQFELARGRRVTGVVRDAVSGQPVAGATLSRSWTFVDPVVSAADGSYALDGLGESEELHVRAAGYVAAALLVPTQTDAPRVDFGLVRGGRLRGRVVDADGNGLGAATVAVARDVWMRANSVHTEWCAAAVGADGWFVVEDLGPGSGQQLTVRCAGHGARTLALPGEVPAGALRDIGAIELRPQALLEGVVVDVDGSPVAGADVHLFGNDRDFAALLPGETKATPLFPFAHRRTHTAADGVFRIAGLAAGDYDLSVTQSGKEWSHEQQIGGLAAGELRCDLRIVVDIGRTLGGVVRVPGRSGLPDGCHMALIAQREGEELQWAKVAADGRFTFERMQGAAYRISAMDAPAGFALVPREGVAPGPDNLELVLAPAERISGQVVDGDGKPLRGVRINFFATGDTVARSFATDHDGQFSFEVPPGAVGRLSASDPDQFFRQVTRADTRAGEVGLVLRLP